MYTVVVVLHILNCFVLCVVVLLQASKGGGLAGAFGGGGAPQQIFGARGMTTILHKITIYCAVGFFMTSTVLFGLTAKREDTGGSVVQDAVTQGALTSDVAQPLPTDEPLFPGLPTEGDAPTEAATGTEGGQPAAGATDTQEQSGGGTTTGSEEEGGRGNAP